MSVGNQPTKQNIDQQLSNLAVQARQLAQGISNLWTQVNNGAAGSAQAVLASYGYNGANADAPGNQSDAAYASYLLNTLHTLAQVYGGQATQPQEFDFDNALSYLWNGS